MARFFNSFNLFRHINFTDVIRTSIQIREELPVRYQLQPEKESLDGEKQEESRLRRWTLGKRDHSKVNKTILLVGQTGTGKSTMINNMTNYVMGVEMEDKVWFEIVKEEGRSQSESQTTTVTVYQIFGFEGRRVPYSLTIIDTPGYGDTRGIREDEIIVEKLHDLFRSGKGIHEIDAVGFLLKSSTNRVDDQQKYVFNEVASLFGKDMENNIVFLMTHSDGMPPTDALKAIEEAGIKCAKDKNGKPVHFLFNNRQKDVITKNNEVAFKFAWDVTENGTKQFFNFLNKAKPQKLSLTIDVMKERKRLKACIGNLKERVELIDLKQNEIQQTENAIKKHKEEMEKVEALLQEKKTTLEEYNQAMQKNQNFEYEFDELHTEKVPIDAWWDTKAVTCNICKENCHYPGCTLAINPSWCEVFKKDKDGVLRCTSCTGKCTVDNHVKEKCCYVTRTEKVKKTYEKKKIEYEVYKQHKAEVEKKMKDVEETKDNTANEANKMERLLSELRTEKKNLERDKITCLEQAYQHVVRLEEIALKTGSLSFLVHLDFLIKKMKETRDQEKVQKLEEMKRRAGKGREGLMSYISAVKMLLF